VFQLTKIIMKKTSFFNALVLALGFGSLQAQYDDKIHVVGEHLSNFSITERCCGKEGYVVAGTRGQNQEVLVTAMDTMTAKIVSSGDLPMLNNETP
jgi:hypothetical protein